MIRVLLLPDSWMKQWAIRSINNSLQKQKFPLENGLNTLVSWKIVWLWEKTTDPTLERGHSGINGMLLINNHHHSIDAESYLHSTPSVLDGALPCSGKQTHHPWRLQQSPLMKHRRIGSLNKKPQRPIWLAISERLMPCVLWDKWRQDCSSSSVNQSRHHGLNGWTPICPIVEENQKPLQTQIKQEIHTMMVSKLMNDQVPFRWLSLQIRKPRILVMIPRVALWKSECRI
mmetsp:Transcript_31975/g.45464  ORF Transcript_31975/g.45464 Transcript_31975/m.45464 type:complete len:230 (+) Transcript_31975:261-950(+)